MRVLRNHVAEFTAVCAASIRRTFAGHLPLYISALLFVPATAAITYSYRAPFHFDASLFFLVTVPKFMAVGLFLAALVQFVRLARAGSRSPLREFGGWAYHGVVSHDRPGNIVHSVVTITPLMISFTALKHVIPLIKPFSWDPTFERLDRILGFGHMPWQILQPLLGFPAVTAAIDIAYVVWFAVMFGTLVWQAFFARGGMVRMQFLLAFSLSWFLAGNVLALIFSSAGPCYYGFLFSPDPYAAPLEYLRQIDRGWPLAALQIQDRLWDSYVALGGVNIGISAMPSMHVEMATLVALVAWRTRRWLGIIFTTYAGLVVVGSVHLVWHYAVDSLGAIALALLFWTIAGALVRLLERLEASQRAALIPAALPTAARE